MEDADSLFVKEKYTKGYQVTQKDGSDKNLYVVFKGKFRILYNTNEVTKLNPYALKLKHGSIVLDHLRQGQIFGADGAIND